MEREELELKILQTMKNKGFTFEQLEISRKFISDLPELNLYDLLKITEADSVIDIGTYLFEMIDFNNEHYFKKNPNEDLWGKLFSCLVDLMKIMFILFVIGGIGYVLFVSKIT